MGTAIAAVFLRSGVPVLIYDNAPDFQIRTQSLLWEQYLPSRFDLSNNPDSLAHSAEPCPWQTSGLVQLTNRLTDLADSDLVIESIVEIVEVKEDLYRQLEPIIKPDCLVGTNTSTIPLSVLDSVWTRPERFCGIHFLHPVRHRQLTEIIQGPKSDPQTVQLAASVMRQVGQRPLPVRSCPGFVVNRLLHPYINEGLKLLKEGVDMDQIDQAAVEFGMAWGPIKTMDEIGIDVVLNSGRVLYEAFPERIDVSPILVSLYKSKCWGVKSGQGFRVYDGSERKKKALDWQRWIEKTRDFTNEEIVSRLIGPMVQEGRRILAEGIVDSPDQIETAVCDGLAFPRSKGPFLKFV